ncbi:MAG: zinc ribbon domain-containing protein [Chloroflexota bacterium]
MPAYDYVCAACGRRFEVAHGVHAEGPTSCPLCGKGPVRKAISAPAVHYKGSGWAKKERRATVTPGAAKASDGGSDADASSAETGDSADGKRSGTASPSTAGSKADKADKADRADNAERTDRAEASRTADAPLSKSGAIKPTD